MNTCGFKKRRCLRWPCGKCGQEGSLAPTATIVLLAAALIFIGQYVISLCLDAIFGHPPTGTDKFNGYPLWIKYPWTIGIAPLYETLVFQWAIIKLVHGWLQLPWMVAALVSSVVFGPDHGHADWRAARMLFTAAILATVFIIESRRSGPAFRATFLAHATKPSRPSRT